MAAGYNKQMVVLTWDPIDTEAALARVQSTQAGALVLFLGTTREFTSGRQTTRLAYEGYEPMAQRTLESLEHEARQRWTLVDAAIVHRLGVVELGEASVLVAVSSAHRGAAFEAAQWIMDRIKEDVPIWKQENWADGTQQWVHPGIDRGSNNEKPHRST